MNTHLMVLLSIALGAVALSPAAASAQSLGVYRFQLQPYCNVLTLTVIQQSGVFILQGFDDHCGEGGPTAVVGSGFPRADGLVGLGLTTVLRTGGAPVSIDASVHVVSFNGAWRDSIGNAGGFVFTPSQGIGGSRRGGPANGIAQHSIAFEQLGEDVQDAIPPRDRFSFMEDGSFFVFNQALAQLGTPFTAFGWLAQTGVLAAFVVDPTASGGGSLSGLGAWAGGFGPTVDGDYAFAFGDHTRAAGDASIAFGRKTATFGDGAFAMGTLTGACGDNSVALGTLASTASTPDFTGDADAVCDGNPYGNAFVFSDGSAPTFPDSSFFPAGGNNTFLARATGGIRFLATTGTAGCGMTAGGTTWGCSSDRNLKERFEPLNGEDVLRKLTAMPVGTWSFIDEPGVRHAGPMAQDFRRAFGLGSEDTTIGYTDINGINMRAIQALEARTRELEDLKARLATLERLVTRLLEGP